MHLKKHIIFIVCALLIVVFSSAKANEFQVTKTAVVNVNKVVQSMPESKNLQKNIQNQFADRIEEIKRLEKKLTSIQEKARKDAALMNAKDKRDLAREMELLRAEGELKSRALSEDMQKEQADARARILNKIKVAIEAVAKEKKLDIVHQGNSIAYTNENLDISDAVISQLKK